MFFLEVKPSDKNLIDKIAKNEIECFSEKGGADMWMIMSFIRYGKLFVLIDDEKLLSVAQFQGVFGKMEVFLYGFSTVISERKKGYAKELLIQCHKRLKELDIKKIYLTVDPKNIVGVNLYIKMGYSIVELQKNEYGTDIDRYLMIKKL